MKFVNPVLISLVISGTWLSGAQACDYFFGDVLASARSADTTYSAQSERACTQYVIGVPKKLSIVKSRPGPVLAALRIGSTYFCYTEGYLTGYTTRSDCTAKVPASDYYSDLLEPGEYVQLDVLEGEAGVSVVIAGERP